VKHISPSVRLPLDENPPTPRPGGNTKRYTDISRGRTLRCTLAPGGDSNGNSQLVTEHEQLFSSCLSWSARQQVDPRNLLFCPTFCIALEGWTLEIHLIHRHVSLIPLGLILSILAPPLLVHYHQTDVLQRKAAHSRVTSIHIHMWPTRESNSWLTNNRTDLWEPCVCVCVCLHSPGGPLCVCQVRGGRGFNKGTGLVRGCQSDCLGTCNLMGSRWEPPDRTAPS